MNVAAVLKEARQHLDDAGVVEPLRDSRKILRHLLSETSAVLDPDYVLTKKELSNFRAMIQSRSLRQPVAQIIGLREFWGRDFAVTSDTLDPRPDSELIVELALRGATPNSILDLGTGTGCLLLTLLSEWPAAFGFGVDISPKALDVARENAAALRLSGRASLLQSDWFSEVEGRFDLIVCNPPYISTEEMADLTPDVASWEPPEALTPGDDGVSVYRKLSREIEEYLTSSGTAIFEIGASQGEAVRSLFATAGFEKPELIRDINGKDRALVVHKH